MGAVTHVEIDDHVGPPEGIMDASGIEHKLPVVNTQDRPETVLVERRIDDAECIRRKGVAT